MNMLKRTQSRSSATSILLFALLCQGMGCQYLQRHQDSGYSDKSSGSATTTTNKPAPKAVGVRSIETLKPRLRSMENSLSTKKEIEQYSKALPYFKNDDERLDFLSLTDYEERQKWLNTRSFQTRPQETLEEMKELIEAQDITVGMPQNLVRKSWGEPDTVEVSGNPAYRNERWRYNRFVSTSDGYKAEKKTVYFEGGKVVGWELE